MLPPALPLGGVARTAIDSPEFCAPTGVFSVVEMVRPKMAVFETEYPKNPRPPRGFFFFFSQTDFSWLHPNRHFRLRFAVEASEPPGPRGVPTWWCPHP